MASIGAKAFNLVLRFGGIGKGFLDEKNARAEVVKDRTKGPAKPGSWIQKNCEIEEFRIDGHPNFTITPRKTTANLHVIFFHGGGYAYSITDFHWKFIAQLIKRTGASITVPLYPKAPEQDWAAAYPVMLNLYDQLLDKADRKNIVFMGDSAGAGWSLGLAQMLRDQGKPLPGKLVLLSPWLDAEATDPMQPAIEPKDHILSIDGIRAMGRWWAGPDNGPADFPISPIHASLDNLPPMIAFSGTHDILHPDTLALQRKADAAGIALDCHIYPEMQHDWILFPIREARQAIDQLVGFLAL